MAGMECFCSTVKLSDRFNNLKKETETVSACFENDENEEQKKELSQIREG